MTSKTQTIARPLFKMGALFFCILTVSCAKRCGRDEPSHTRSSNIVIGALAPLSGGEATFGTSLRDGIELAVSTLNKQGGINGRPLQSITYDTQGKAEDAVRLAIKLIKQDEAIAVIGEMASSRSLAIAPIAQANQTVMLSPASTNPAVTQMGNYIFRACYVDSFQGTVMGIFAANDLKATNAAILRDMSSDYSLGLAREFKMAFERLGGHVLKEESYQAGDANFKAQLTAIKQLNPDVIFIPGYYTEVGLMMRQARELGIQSKLIGSDGWDSARLTEIAGDAAENAFFSNHYSEQNHTPEVDAFVRDFEKTYSHKPDGFAALGYDSVFILADALKRTQVVNRENVRNELARVRSLPTVTGKITFTPERNPLKPAVVLKIQKGSFVYQTQISPYPMP